MANMISNVITVVGFGQPDAPPKPADFKAWLVEVDNQRPNDHKYGFDSVTSNDEGGYAPTLSEPWVFENISHPRFTVWTQWDIMDMQVVSSLPQCKGLIFHHAWYPETAGENWYGVATVRNGKVIDSWETRGHSERLFRAVQDPEPDFLVEHAGLTLAQLAKYRVAQAGKVIDDMAFVLRNMDTTQGGYGAAFSGLRNLDKVAAVTAEIAALQKNFADALARIDFTDVFLEVGDPRVEAAYKAEHKAEHKAELELANGGPEAVTK